MHLHSAPAYSIGGAPKPKMEERLDVPGPGAYTSQKIPSLLHNPSWKIGTDKRDHSQKSLTPGPGTYEAKGYTTQRQPITIKNKPKDHKPDYVPGPGSYNPDFNKVAKNEPSYKLPREKKLSTLESNAAIPGPGSYNTVSEGMSKQGVKFGSQKRLGFDINKQNPGPGSYYGEKQALLLNSLPKYSFGTSQRANDTNVRSPGPGSYDTKGELQKSSLNKRGFSISSKRRETLPIGSSAPGPGAYDPQNASSKNLRKSPAYSIGHEAKLPEKEYVTIAPSPLNYVVKDDLTRKKTSIVIGKSKRDTLDTSGKAQVPGPGSYSNKDIIGNEGPKFSITHSRTSIKVSQVPGPGTYNPQIKPVTLSDGRTIIGKEKRSSDPKGISLGPGQYEPYVDEHKGKGYTIGHEKRDLQKGQAKPGPGYYDHQSTISNVPKYAQGTSRHQ